MSETCPRHVRDMSETCPFPRWPAGDSTHTSVSTRRAAVAVASGLGPPTRQVLFIQMQLCERTMRAWLNEPGRDGGLPHSRTERRVP